MNGTTQPAETPPDRGVAADGAVAVIGLACRVPGARSVEQFWHNLLAGVESITFFSRDELLAAGLSEERVDDPRLIAAGGCLDGIDEFDATFFGITPREAELLDPQHRLFLEVAWEALERAGYGAEQAADRIGVFAGAALNGYLLANIAPQIQQIAEDGSWQILLGNDKDYLTTRASYLLGLTGPSLLVQTACSTSLVAIHTARESILRGECEMALAGGISGRVPQARAHLYREGGINSPDGHCRAFDASARGTVGGNGIGVVVLKQLAAARRDGDRIVAVLKGSAVNHDGGRKVGFTAPSVAGQAAVIRAALATAGVAGESIGYVEAHGTGTPPGDTIEVQALAQALGGGREEPCLIGSVKTNIGHLDTAAGVVGFIKAALVVEHGEIPPSLHCEVPNPQIAWEAGPFEVVRERRAWRQQGPRRAGVSAFGIGGTNAHAVLEQAPERPGAGPSRPFQLLVWSAKTAPALEEMSGRLGRHLAEHPEQALADVAWTLARGRRRFGHRRALVVASTAEAAAALGASPRRRSPGSRGWEEAQAEAGEAPLPVAFLFPGQGSVYPGMGEELLHQEPVFRAAIERCSALLARGGGEPLLERLYGPPEGRWTAPQLERTQNAQPALFAVSYALAELWRSWGLEPRAMLGHSLGEYVAATLAEVLTLEAALELVRVRADLMGNLTPGAMLSVELSAEEARELSSPEISLAAENGPRLSVLSGPVAAIAGVEAALAARGVSCRRLATSHAFHSSLLDPILEDFGAAVSRIELSPPRRPYLSCRTGDWIRAEEATDPAYWVRHLREPVRFSTALATLLGGERIACLEVGPGRALCSLVRRQPSHAAGAWALGSLPPPGAGEPRAGEPGAGEPESAFALRSLGRYWLAGGRVDWPGVYAGETRRREPLPPYPFERQRHWLERPTQVRQVAPAARAEAHETIEASRVTTPPAHSSRPRLPSAYVAPASDAERTLVEIWQSLLHIAPIGIDDDFFEQLGGHSLLGTQALLRIGSAFGRDLPLQLLFEAPTVARLAAHLAQAGETPAVAEPPLQAAERPAVLPLSFAQQRLWFLDQLDPSGAVNSVYLRVRFTGDLAVAVLERALGELVRRHEVLRTTFANQGWHPAQWIAPPSPSRLPVVDLSALPARDALPAGLMLRLTAEHQLEPFDLRRGPLFTVRLLRLGRREHQLLLNLHHIVSDGWSVGVIAREIAALYEAFSQGQPSPLAELPLQYADYALWQRQWLQGELLERELAYWRRQLAGLSPDQDLPTAAPRPATHGFRAGEVPLRLPAALSEALRSLAHREGASLFMTLLAAFEALLLRMVGQEDLCVGTPVAGRSRREIEGLVGLFLNNLALRTDLGGDPPFRALLERVRRTVLEAMAHQHVPFEKLLEELAPERDLSRTPLFRVYFNMLNLPGGEVRLPGLLLEAVASPVQVSKFDLTLYAAERTSGLQLLQVYNAGLFEPVQMARMAEHFRTLLAGVAADPQRRLRDLPVLSDAERRQTERTSLPPSVPAVPFPEAGAIGDRFRAVAAQCASLPAVVEGEGRAATYAELLLALAECAGRALLRHGAPGVRVGLLFEPGIALVAGLLGTLLAGRAYVPLDPRHPRERLELLLADSGAAVLLAGEAQAVLAHELAAGRPVLTVGCEPTSSGPASWPEVGPEVWPEVGGEALAYVLYTSGSTGLPKGVVQNHRNVLRHIRNYVEALGLGPGDRLSLLSSYAFDGAVMDILGALLSGAALCPLDLRAGGGDLAAWVREAGITVYHSTPTVYRLLLQGLREDETLPVLRRVVLGGEEARRSDFAAFRRFAPAGAVFVNGLGPSESTLALQCFLDHEGEVARSTVPAGRPVPGLTVRLLHPGGEQVEVYGEGEIVLEGPQIALGYWGRPAETAAAFVPAPHGRAYRTGDLGRLLPDGSIEFAGRRDQQVKIRGQRVEPGEVEAHLLALPEVAEAAVVPYDDPAGARALAAYVVPSPNAGLTAELAAERLCEALRRRVQEVLVPSAFHLVAALPRTPNGKLDRRALPPLAPGRRERPHLAPRNRKELRLARIWASLLGVEEVGVDDDFFALGGHSLLLLQMVGQVREAFAVDLPLATVYRHSTVAKLVEAIVRAQRLPLLEAGLRLAEGPAGAPAGPAGPARRLVPLQPAGSHPTLFCVHAVGGHLLDFHDLVREVGPDQPVLGLQARGFDSDEEPLTRIEEMAAGYLEAVRAAQPAGPYHLVGYCVGGLAAYEMARQLHAAGEEVALLAVLDARADQGRRAELDATVIAGYAAYSFAAELNLRIAPERIERESPERWMDTLWQKLCLQAEATARALGPATFRRLYRVFVANRLASWTYRPGPYHGGLLVFEPAHDGEDAASRDGAAGWRALCSGPVEQVTVPGGHVSMMRAPQVATLAGWLRTAITSRTLPNLPFLGTEADTHEIRRPE